MSPMGLVKFLGAWGCITAAVVLMILGHQLAGLPGILSLLSIAFSQAPTSA